MIPVFSHPLKTRASAFAMLDRNFLSISLTLSLFLALALTASGVDSPRPNIVVMLSDDMGWQQVGYNGGLDGVPTPAIDSIAREGIKLTQFYVQPVCSPTRGAFMTGRYPWKNGTEVRPTATAKQGMLLDERTIAEALHDAGYATWMIGKWHLGEWQSQHLPLQRGFDYHYGHYSALIDCFTHTRGGVLDWHRNEEPVIEEGYSSFLLAAEAAKLIKGHDGKKPFFLYVPFNAVHGPHQAPEEYLKKYKHLGAPGAQRAQLECMDIAIGQVLKAIDDKGIRDDTLVIYTNDNGGTKITSNGPYRGFKSDFHEGGMRVPFAARWPGHIQAGSSSDEMAHVVDLFPTFCSLAGASISGGQPLDGMDIWDVLSKNAKSPRKEFAPSIMVLRQGDWKLIEEGAKYYSWPKQELQLYNIKNDPYETNNLAGKNPDLVKKLRARLLEYRKEARPGEPEERIPGFPVAVYGEQENAKYGDAVKARVAELGLLEKDATR
jgi:arylsulfatase A-like enzyme